MRFDNVGQATAKKFRTTGQFILTDLMSATAGVSGDLVSLLKLVILLEFLHVIARVLLLSFH